MPDTGGPGAHRGGMAQVLEFCTTAPDAFVTARNRDRSMFQPWGILGGQPGAPGTFTLNPNSEQEQHLGNTDALRLAYGDVLRIVSPAGGGRGDPFTRDPAQVLRDVRAGLVTVDAAARDYGVAIVEDAVDASRTSSLREAGVASPSLTLGDYRIAHEAVWTSAAYSAMHELLSTLPPSWRAPMKSLLFAAVRAAPETSAETVIRGTFAVHAKRHARAAE
jgi:N-methylhydantoinase B